MDQQISATFPSRAPPAIWVEAAAAATPPAPISPAKAARPSYDFCILAPQLWDKLFRARMFVPRAKIFMRELKLNINVVIAVDHAWALESAPGPKRSLWRAGPGLIYKAGSALI